MKNSSQEYATAKLTSTQNLLLLEPSIVNHTSVTQPARLAMVHTEINVSLALINTGHTKLMVHANRSHAMQTALTATVKVNSHALSANQELNLRMLVERTNANAKLASSPQLLHPSLAQLAIVPVLHALLLVPIVLHAELTLMSSVVPANVSMASMMMATIQWVA